MLYSPKSVADKLLVLLLFWWSGNIPEEEEEGELHCANARRQLTSDDDLGATAAAPLIAVASVRPSVRRLSGAVEHFNGDFQFLSVSFSKGTWIPKSSDAPSFKKRLVF